MNPQYRKPPITEAILDLRVEPRPGASAAELLAGLASLEEAFPVRREIRFEPEFATRAGGAINGFSLTVGNLLETAALGGFRYESADGRRIVQARHNGFVFSFVGTEAERYPGWEAFRAEAHSLWETYTEAWRPVAVVRAALRYVNQFPVDFAIPETTGVHPGDYLSAFTVPRPDLLTNLMVGDLDLRVTLPQPDIEATAIVNNALAPAATVPTGTGIMLLDIDIFQQRRIQPESDELWEQLETLRTRKNQLFRAWITQSVENTLEPIQ